MYNAGYLAGLNRAMDMLPDTAQEFASNPDSAHWYGKGYNDCRRIIANRLRDEIGDQHGDLND